MIIPSETPAVVLSGPTPAPLAIRLRIVRAAQIDLSPKGSSAPPPRYAEECSFGS